MRAESKRPDLDAQDFSRSPFLVIWETTRACDLACKHCRADAIRDRNPLELSTDEAMALMRKVREFGRPLFVLTGGDPLKRPDAVELVAYGASLGLRMAMTPSGTPLMTAAILRDLRDAGLSRLAVSLDGSAPAIHDTFRGVDGSYVWTLRMLEAARELGLSTQVNTTVTRHNLDDFDALCALMTELGIALWSVFFLVPTGRAQAADVASAEAFEAVFHKMYELSAMAPFDIKSTAAPQYRRVILQRQVGERRSGDRASAPTPMTGGIGFSLRDGVGRAKGVNDGDGFVFVSHTGEIFPSGFLPLSAGNVRRDDLVEVYREDPLFVALRDRSKLKGKCGVCEYREVCGGSRARAYALTGDILESEPFCTHVPRRYQRMVREFEPTEQAAGDAVGSPTGRPPPGRRRVRTLTPEETHEFLRAERWGVLATVADGRPYAVPVAYGYDGSCVYIASGPGRKADSVDDNPAVCFTVARVDGADRGWSSAVVLGRAEWVRGVTARIRGFEALRRQQRGAHRSARDAAKFARARLLCIRPQEITGRSTQ